MLGAVRTKVADEQGNLDKLGGQVVDRFKRLAKRIRWSQAISVVGKSALGLSLPSFDDVIGIIDDGAPEDAPPDEPTLQGFRDDFAALMAELPQIRRVVVLIDDLDRSLPETVVASLEAIKLFLSVPKMGFVVAADRRLVALSIADRYRPAPQAEAMARQYLEKIIQIPLTVPALGRGDTEAYLALLLLERHLPDAADKLAGIISHSDTQRRASAPRILDDLPDQLVPDGAGADFALAAQLSPVLYERTQGNPRRLKRFLNAFWLRSDIAGRRGVQLDPGALAKLLVLEELEPEQFITVIEWLNRGELKAQLAALEDPDASVATPDPHATLRAWARQAPSIAELNLEPYLRLAASLAAKPTAGTALRSDLQALLEGLLDPSAGKRRAAAADVTAFGTDDRLAVARELVSAARADPERQDDIAESLGKLVSTDDAVAADIATRLREFDASEVRAPLIVRMMKATRLPAMRDTVAAWVASGGLDALAAKVAERELSPRRKDS